MRLSTVRPGTAVNGEEQDCSQWLGSADVQALSTWAVKVPHN